MDIVPKALYLLRRNIEDLLRRRGETQVSLAKFCGHEKSWINKILNEGRGLRVKDLDNIGSFFGLQPYQLFQPGIAPYTERRTGHERRTGRERRIGHAHRDRHRTDVAVAAAHPRRLEEPLTLSPGERLLIDYARDLQPREFEALLGMLDLTGKKGRKKA